MEDKDTRCVKSGNEHLIQGPRTATGRLVHCEKAVNYKPPYTDNTNAPILKFDMSTRSYQNKWPLRQFLQAPTCAEGYSQSLGWR